MNKEDFEKAFWNKEHTFNINDVMDYIYDLKKKWAWVEQYAEEQRAEAKKEFLEEIIQDMFDATALSIPMDYIYDLKKKLEEKK